MEVIRLAREYNGFAIAGTSIISGLLVGQWVTLALRLNGSSLSVEIHGGRASYTIPFALHSQFVKFICIEWNF